MLKTSKAVVAAVLIAGSASVALADARFDVDLYRGNPAPEPIYAAQYQGAQYHNQDARAAYAYAPRSQALRSVPSAVYENGQYVGQDPDINVRLNLRRETPPQ